MDRLKNIITAISLDLLYYNGKEDVQPHLILWNLFHSNKYHFSLNDFEAIYSLLKSGYTGDLDLKEGDYCSYNEELGRIKSVNGLSAFVVYKCGEDWDNYKNYTGVSTPINKLKKKIIL